MKRNHQVREATRAAVAQQPADEARWAHLGAAVCVFQALYKFLGMYVFTCLFTQKVCGLQSNSDCAVSCVQGPDPFVTAAAAQ